MYGHTGREDSSRSTRATRRGGNASVSQQSNASRNRSESQSSDSDRPTAPRQSRRENSPQPGPSGLMRTANRRIQKNLAELNLSESSDEDDSGSSGNAAVPMDMDMDLNNDLDDNYNIGDQEENMIGANTFQFNADTPLAEFGDAITAGIFEKGKGNTRASKFIFSAAQMPKTKAELRREYSTLIEKCQGFEDNDPDFNLKELLNENIIKGNQLFKVIGGGPGDMYMAFLHTKMCSGMLKHTMDMIGNSSSVFKKDLFIEGVKNWSFQGQADVQRYNPKYAVAAISMVASECCTAMPHMVAMVGACNRDRITAPPKQKKPRAPPKRKIFDTNSALATQHEEINSAVNKNAEPEKTRAEAVAQEISSILKKKYKESSRPTPLLEFTMSKNSLADTVEHLFYVGFLIRDGLASLSQQRRVSKKSLANLVIKPAEPPQKKTTDPSKTAGGSQKQADDGSRYQYILSFSPKQWKTLSHASRGEDMLKISKPKPKPTKSK